MQASGLGVQFEGRCQAFLAGGGVFVRDEDNVISVFAGESSDPAVPDLTDTLPTLLAQDLAGGNDVGGDLRDIGGILPNSGFDDRYSFAHATEQCLAGVLFGLGGLAVARMITEAVGWKVRHFVAHNVPKRSVAAVRLHPIDVRFYFDD